MPRSKQRRHGVNRDRKKQAAQSRQQSEGGLSTLNLPEGVDFLQLHKGKNTFDILPYEVSVSNHPQGTPKGELWDERTFFIHRDVGPEEKVFICPLKTAGKPCPICEEHARLKAQEGVDNKTLDALRPKKRQLFNVMDRSEKASGEVQVLEMSYWTFGKALDALLCDEDYKEFWGYSDLEGGFSLRVTMTEESGGEFKFLDTSRIDFVPRKKDYPEDILEEVVDLDKVLKIPSYNDLKAEFEGTAPEEEAGSDGDDGEEATSTPSDNQEPEDDGEEQDGGSSDTPAGRKECPACEGTGKNSKGKTCRICDGEGHVEDEEDDGGEAEAEAEAEAEKTEKPKKSGKKKGGRTAPPPDEEDGGEDDKNNSGSSDDEDWGDEDWGD